MRLNCRKFERNIRRNCRESLTEECHFSTYFEHFFCFSSDFFDVSIDFFETSIFTDEFLSFFWSESWNTRNIIATISTDSEIINDVFSRYSEFLYRFFFSGYCSFHHIIDGNIFSCELVEIFISREDIDVIFWIFSELHDECSDDVICFVSLSGYRTDSE